MVERLNWCAYTPTAKDCDATLAKIRAEGVGYVENFLDDIPVENWTNAYFQGKRYGEMTSNAAESFNAWILVARSLPVMNLVDTIREQLMSDFTKCRKLGWSMKGSICPNFDKLLVESQEAGITWDVIESSDDVYEVKFIPSVFVNIADRTCECFKWQLDGFPCVHAVAAIQSCGKNLADFVEDYFHTEFYRLTYAYSVFPIPSLGKPVVRVEDIVVRPPK